MARTSLFSRLERGVSRLVGDAPSAGRLNSRCAESAVSRRRLIRAGAALGLSACATESGPLPLSHEPVAQRVAVIGAGLAGLHCAFRLAQAGVDVTVYEANTRVGGRAFTARRLFGDSVKLIAELGGEFIASEHSTMLSLAEELRVELAERPSETTSGLADVYWLSGKEVPAPTVNDQLAATAPRLVAALASADHDSDAFRDLDNTSLSTFLEQRVPKQAFPELSALLAIAFRAEFGLEPDEQSALNALYLVGPGTRRGLNAATGSSASFQVRGGSDTFTTQLGARLGARVKLRSRLAAIRPSHAEGLAPTFQLSFETETASGFVTEAEHVVFALPFGVLRRLDLSALELSEGKAKLIDELGYGTHSKLLGAFRATWREQQRSGNVSSDLPFQQVWDASVGQTDAQSAAAAQGILSNLLGGSAGAKANTVQVAASMAALLSDLNGPIPGIGAAYLSGSAVRMHWPSSPLFRGSTACYRPGQWALRGSEGRREGNLHFCGEHCSVDYQGRMEGAAETGALVAARILDELRLPWPSALSTIVAPKLSLPQPCYHGATGAELGFWERREKLPQ